MLTILRRISLTQWILISMVAGIAMGRLFPEASQHLKVLSTVFLNLIKCLLVPLIFSTLVVGVAGHGGEPRTVGRLAVKAIVYFEIVTTLALVVGLVAVNLFRPGDGLQLPPPHSTSIEIAPAAAVTGASILEHLVPKSVFDAAAKNDVLQVVCFTLLFAIALTQAPPKARDTLVEVCDALAETMFQFVGLVMKFAPLGVGAAMAFTVGHSGLGALLNLGKLILTLYGALVVFFLIVLVPAAWIAKIPLWELLTRLKEPALLAFSTTSSDAAMPDAMKRLMAFGVPRQIVSFVMPLGYSFNLDGSTLYLAVASIFIAQAAKIELTLSQQLAMMLSLMLTSKGMAGVPRASQVILAGTLASFGLPLEGLVLIMGVDELMDMARTTVNLIGNCLATVVVARWEGQLELGRDQSKSEH